MKTLTLLAVCLSLLASACAAPAPTAGSLARPLTVCYSGLSGAHGVTWYAVEKGLFQKHGLAVTVVGIESGSKAAAALIAGDVQFCQMAGTAVVNAAAAGEDLVMIGGLFNEYLYSLMVGPEIKSADDLRGKVVASNVAGDATEMGLQVALTKLGLRPGKDVTIVPVGQEAARLTAMQAGRVAGTVFVVPGTRQAEEQGFHELLSMSGPDYPYPRVGIATTRPFLQAERPLALQFMRAISEAVALMRQDPAGSQAALAKYLSLDPLKDRAILEEAYTELYLGRIMTIPYPTIAGMQGVIDFSAATNPKVGALRADDLVDLSIVTELERSGFIAGLYR